MKVPANSLPALPQNPSGGPAKNVSPGHTQINADIFRLENINVKTMRWLTSAKQKSGKLVGSNFLITLILLNEPDLSGLKQAQFDS